MAGNGEAMGKYDKLMIKILSGTADQNMEFSDLCTLLSRLGFQERIKAGHHIFSHDKIMEILNLQSKRSKAKPYQVKQVRDVILKYKLGDTNVH